VDDHTKSVHVDAAAAASVIQPRPSMEEAVKLQKESLLWSTGALSLSLTHTHTHTCVNALARGSGGFYATGQTE